MAWVAMATCSKEAMTNINSRLTISSSKWATCNKDMVANSNGEVMVDSSRAMAAAMVDSLR